MSFLSPLSLLFGATIPLVVLFYLLKRRRTRQLVSSTVLWQRFLAENQANAPFQRLRKHWLLILQILLLLLAVLALGRPYFSGDLSKGRLQVVILDASASMKAEDGAPTRFEAARSQILQLIDGMREQDQMVLIAAGVATEVKQSAVSSKSTLRRMLMSSQPSDGPTRLTDALKLAETLTRESTSYEVHLFSDGVATDLGSFAGAGVAINYHRVGSRGSNVGVTGIDVRGHPEDPRQRMVLATVFNSSSNLVQTSAEFSFEGRLLEAKPVSIEPRATASLVFTAAQAKDGVFTVRLPHADDLKADNEASVVSLLPKPVKVVLVTAGNAFLERALRSTPGVELAVVPVLGEGGASADVVVLDRITPTPWPETRVLAIRASAPGWFTNAVETDAAAVVDWRASHPLLRSVAVETLQVAKALEVQAPSWASSLIDAARTPLVFSGEFEKRRVIWVGFDLYQSTWPLRVSFPIFISNAIEWLGASEREEFALTAHTGDTMRLQAPPGVSEFEIVNPDGVKRVWKLETGRRELLFGDTGRAGVYRCRAGTNDWVFSVNLASSEESDLWPREALSLGKHAATPQTAVRRADLEGWRFLAATGLVVLLWEWWYYHRRTV